MEKKAMYPGSFDPITLGHVDIIERAAQLFDHVYVVISINPDKSSLFSLEERVEFAKLSLAHLPNVTIDVNNGFVYQYALDHNCCTLIRGLRTITDFQSETQLFDFNYQLSKKKIDTVALFADSQHIFLSSSVVKEILTFNGDITPYVPEQIVNKIYDKLKNR